MPPLYDDDSIAPDQMLIRALRPGWTAPRANGSERPNRLAFTDGTQETSCFIDNEINLAEIRRLFPGDKICRFRAAAVRAAGFVIMRKPEDCPADFAGEPTHHLVIGPEAEIRKKELMKRGDLIALSPDSEVLPPD